MNPVYAIFHIVRHLWARLNHRGIVEVLVNDYPQTLQDILQNHPELIRPAPDGVKPWMREVCEHLSAGRLIGAIGAYREATGLGLKEAKDLCVALREGTPIRFDCLIGTPDNLGYRRRMEEAHAKAYKALPLTFRQQAYKAWAGRPQ